MQITTIGLGVIGENKFTYDLWGRQREHCQSDGIPWTAGAAFR